MKYPGKDPWYFGDYLGGLPGNNYSLLLNSIIVLLLAQIALSTEPSLDTKVGNFYLDFALNLIELFFITDYVGKLSNTWSLSDYSISGLISSFFQRGAFIDLGIVLVLVTEVFPNDSFVVIGIYILKSLLSIYYSGFQRVLKRVQFILTDSPGYTFFPLVLLAIVTYVMAFCIYLLERDFDSEHFGSITRALWFSIVTSTTIGYGDVTPSTTLGKFVAIGFGIVGIVCVALLTANILESNSRFNALEEPSDA